MFKSQQASHSTKARSGERSQTKLLRLINNLGLYAEAIDQVFGFQLLIWKNERFPFGLLESNSRRISFEFDPLFLT
jgi:hypothetical protein